MNPQAADFIMLFSNGFQTRWSGLRFYPFIGAAYGGEEP
jgi:hypothetical protein